MYTEFLKLCGFESQEIKKELPRLEKAFKILGLGLEDVKQAEERIVDIFDTQLKGVRKFLGIWIKELLAMVLAKEEGKKVIYGIWPAPCEPFLAALLPSRNVYVGFPDITLVMILGGMFNKLSPILEAAERHALPAGAAHCSLNQTRLGAHLLGIIPKADLSIAWGVICDESPKTEELLHEIFGQPVVYCQRCQDEDLAEYKQTFPEVNPRSIEFLASEMTKANRKLEEVLGFKITDEILAEATKKRREFAIGFLRLVELMKADPIPISQANLTLPHILLNCSYQDLEAPIEAIHILCEEVEQRVKAGVGVVEKGAPRVLHSLLASLGDPGLTRMIEELGIAIPLVEGAYTHPARPTTKLTDPTQIIARRLLRQGLMSCISARIDGIAQACRDWNLDGVIWVNHFACRQGGTDAYMLKKAVTEKLGIPMMVLDADIYDSRDYTRHQMRTRIETFAEMLRVAKATRGK